jgi:Uma2 family endonuclease
MSVATIHHEIVSPKPAEPEMRRWTSEEYELCRAEGFFDGQRVQLINGEIINMPAMGHNHVGTVDAVAEYLRAAFGSLHWVRMQFPLKLGPRSNPEPDVAVVEHPRGHYTDHPTTALMVVEVTDTTLRLDRRKVGLYASAGIAEYWLINLPAEEVEVYRNPVPDAGNEFGYNFGPPVVLGLKDELSPLARPGAKMKVSDLLK